MRSIPEPEGLEELEELGDDAIISQQTAAHTPQPRANISEESRSVVITDHPLRRDTEPPRNSAQPRRPAAEPTLMIRDRRALDELRHDLERRKADDKKRTGRRALYMWSALGLAAFVLGGLVAFLATDSHPDAPAAESSAQPARVEAQLGLPPAATPTPTATSVGATAAPPSEPTRAVRLDDLPLESPSKR